MLRQWPGNVPPSSPIDFHPAVRRARVRWLACLAVTLLFPAVAFTAPAEGVVGSVDGAFEVSADGAATWTAPIEVPPGIGGVQPQLAIRYRSDAGNGLLGIGGQLSGISSITRCAATAARDGAAHGVEHTHRDRFCLDGIRLVAVRGDYGADGTEYSTEIESWQRVVSNGQVSCPSGSTGVVSFTDEARSGGRVEYGTSAQSKLVRPGTDMVHQWFVSRFPAHVHAGFRLCESRNTAACSVG